MKFKALFLMFLMAGGFFACTDLEETLNEDLNKTTAEEYLNANTDVAALLKGCYEGLRTFHTQDQIWAAQQHTTDETVGPTRGPDWDDNGIWRSLHNHTWTADHAFLASSFNSLLQVVFSTTNLLNFNASAQQKAEARFIRAYVIPGSLPTAVQSAIPNTGGTYIIRIYQGAADCYADYTVTVAAVTCTSCSLTGTGLNNVTCYPNGTATNPADDQIVFSLNPIGTGLGASYTVTVSSGTVTPTTAIYGSTKWFRLNGGSAGAGNVTVTVTDINGGGCTTASVITDPGSCVYSCGTNLLINPSFEADALNTTPPTGWSCSGAGAFVAGNNMDEPDGTKYAFDNGAGTLCQDVAATPGQTFSLTFFSGSHNPSGVQTVTMRYLDSGGATLGTPATHVITFDTDNFTPQILGGPYSLSLPAAPAGTASVRVEVSNGGLDFAKVDAFCMTSTSTCTQPSAPTFTQVAPGCNVSAPLNNGTITLTAVTDGTHFGVSTLNAGSYDGPTTVAGASAITLAQLIKDNIPNTGGTYIVRIFNGADDCFLDQTVTVAPVTCNCPVNACGTTTVIKN